MEFPALVMAALGADNYFFQRLGGHLLLPSRMLSAEWQSVKFGMVREPSHRYSARAKKKTFLGEFFKTHLIDILRR